MTKHLSGLYLSGLILLLALVTNCEPILAKELVREFQGNRSTVTAEFEVRAPWLLDWQVSGEYPGTMAVEVSLAEAGIGVHQGSVVRTKSQDNGVRLFNQSGKFQFRVVSNLASWRLKVEQLTREEAEQYTPVIQP
jgi:hypothetical protein